MKQSVTVKSPINIALVKYWGKLNEDMIIPSNGSISATVAMEAIYTLTTIFFDSSKDKDSLKLNERQMDSIYQKKYPNTPKRASITIESVNNFPTAAGLASSASGMAAVAFGIYKLFELEDTISERQLSIISRQASGSSCRSIPAEGGFVEWFSPTETSFIEDASNLSFAESILASKSMKDLAILIYVISSSSKLISSSEGMQRTSETSDLYRFRINHVVPKRLKEVRDALASGLWSDLFKAIIMESNSLHACCLDSYPPILYLSENSYRIINAVLLFNEREHRAAYSFDAGPNAFVFMQNKDVPTWLDFSSKLIPEIPIIKTKVGFKGVHLIESK